MIHDNSWTTWALISWIKRQCHKQTNTHARMHTHFKTFIYGKKNNKKKQKNKNKRSYESLALNSIFCSLYLRAMTSHNPETKTFLMLWEALFIKHSQQDNNLPGFINATRQGCVFFFPKQWLSVLTGLKFLSFYRGLRNEQLVLYTYT